VRVPPPGLLKLDREALLLDVRARLAEHYPDYADETDLDATDPAWIILEQSAWLVELLSAQLDRYPYSMVQEFVHMMGGRLHPTVPALGMVLVQPAEAGEITISPERPSPWRFFTLQTEEMDMVEFTPVEPSVHVRPATVLNLAEVRDGELYLKGQARGIDGVEAQEAWRTYDRPSKTFAGEWVRYDLISSNADDLVETLTKALESLEERKLGWLEFRVEKISNERVSVFARINLSRAFEQNHPSGLADGTDVRGHWGTLDDSTWTPPVQISNHTGLPPWMRGGKPMPGLRRGTLIIPGVPENFDLANLLERKPMPIPGAVVESIWQTLTHMDQKLATLTPSVHRGVEEVSEEDEPVWISEALDGGLWPELVDRRELRFVHIQVGQFDPTPGKFRLSMVLKGISEESIPDIRVFGFLKAEGLQRIPLPYKVAWRLKMPDPSGGQRMVLVLTLDITLTEHHEQILIATECDPLAVMLNSLLIINAPPVNDGRQMLVTRNIPEPINLLFDDIVNMDVIQHLLRDNIPVDTARILERMPLSYFSVSASAPIQDFQGLWLDPTASSGDGALMKINAPDNNGHQTALRPGKTVTLDWYRRTDGEYGNVLPGAIQVIEQPPRAEPVILSVHNPLATFFGTARENEQEAIERMFSPSGAVPVLPTDWERLFRVSLGIRARGWIVRCWAHAERSLVSSALWPIDDTGFAVDREAMRLRRSLANAGPETLLVVLGPKNRMITEDELDWARGLLTGIVKRQMRRLPIIRKIIVTRFWPLTLRCNEANADIALPTYDIDEMKGEVFSIADPEVRCEPPEVHLFLNAAVVSTEVDIASGDDGDAT
jgi:hypothetical protein